MNPLRMQPTFTIDLPLDAPQAAARLRTAARSDELCAHVMAVGTCLEFPVVATEQRFWSPRLSVQVEPHGDGSRLHARYSPRPEIWTMFMAIYGVMLILMFAATIYGYVQWMFGRSPWGLLALPAGASIIFGLHLASLVGQSWSVDQMQQLRERLDRAIELAFAAPMPCQAQARSTTSDAESLTHTAGSDML
ncbi:hypothetical protein [Roseimaritima sediminicola]|uniref:hypothetical protein n=1 Tax=Roseimaritima sediminicola TaxID=2662066 RepID=UPI00192A4C3B|nr:hypothetical protein [Roseimaritima sediminicola]